MPTFRYQGYNEGGLSESGVIDAGSERRAFETLQSRGLTVFDLGPATSTNLIDKPWYLRDIRIGTRQLPLEEQAVTADLLSTLFGAGLSEREVIQIAAASTDSKIVKRHFERVLFDLENGQTLAQSFEQETRVFASIFTSFFRLGDAANSLPAMLNALATYLRGQSQTRQKIVSALIYPAILTLAAIVLVLIVIFFLAPNLAPLFSSIGKEPPTTLAVLMRMNNFLSGNWHWVASALTLLALSAIVFFSYPRGQKLLRNTIDRLPLIGRVIRLGSLARLCGAADLLLTAGETLPNALRTAADMTEVGAHHGDLFREAAERVEAGSKASQVFDAETTLPATFRELFRVGEETNRLPAMLSAASEALNSQVDRQTQRLLAALTPCLTLVLGLGVGFLIYTLMGAILEINDLAF